MRDEFGEGSSFCKKITYTVENSESVLSFFRNEYNPRIAITVDMIATAVRIFGQIFSRRNTRKR